jgi:hypothetical protein
MIMNWLAASFLPRPLPTTLHIDCLWCPYLAELEPSHICLAHFRDPNSLPKHLHLKKSHAVQLNMSHHAGHAHVEEEIHALEQRLVMLKQKRNSMITICQLPDEVPVLILRKLQVKCTSQRDEEGFFCFRKQSRDVAIATPQFWNWITYTTPVRTSLILSRSERVPLCIDRLSGTK